MYICSKHRTRARTHARTHLYYGHSTLVLPKHVVDADGSFGRYIDGNTLKVVNINPANNVKELIGNPKASDAYVLQLAETELTKLEGLRPLLVAEWDSDENVTFSNGNSWFEVKPLDESTIPFQFKSGDSGRPILQGGKFVGMVISSGCSTGTIPDYKKTLCSTYSNEKMMMPLVTGEKYSRVKTECLEAIPEEDETQLNTQQFLLKRKKDAFMEGRYTSMPDLFHSDSEEIDLSDTIPDLYRKSTMEMHPLFHDADIDEKISQIEKRYSDALKSKMIKMHGDIAKMAKKTTTRSRMVFSGAISLLIIILTLLLTLPPAHGGAVLVNVNYQTAHHDVQILEFLPKNWEVDVWVADEYGEQIPKFLHSLDVNFTIHGIWHFLPNPILPCEGV